MVSYKRLCYENDFFLLVDAYLGFACSAGVYGGGRNVEYALHLLYMQKGDVKVWF